jgi:hypothetical protein
MLLILTGIVIYPARRAVQLSREFDVLAERRARLTTRVEAAQHELAQDIQQLAAANEEIVRLESGQSSKEWRRFRCKRTFSGSR